MMIIKDTMCCKHKLETNILKYAPLTVSTNVPTSNSNSNKTPNKTPSPRNGLTTVSVSDMPAPSPELLELLGLGELASSKSNYDIGSDTKYATTGTKDGYDKGNRRNTAYHSISRDHSISRERSTATVNADVFGTVNVDIDIAADFTRRMGIRVREAIQKRWEQVKR